MTNVTQFHDTTISYKPPEPLPILRLKGGSLSLSVLNEFEEANSGLSICSPYKVLLYGVLVNYRFEFRKKNVECKLNY